MSKNEAKTIFIAADKCLVVYLIPLSAKMRLCTIVNNFFLLYHECKYLQLTPITDSTKTRKKKLGKEGKNENNSVVY